MLSRSQPQLFSVGHQPPAPVAQPSLASGCCLHTMSIDASSGALSGLLRVPADGGSTTSAPEPPSCSCWMESSPSAARRSRPASTAICQSRPPRFTARPATARRRTCRGRRGRSASRKSSCSRASPALGRRPSCRAFRRGRCTSRCARATPRPTRTAGLTVSSGWCCRRRAALAARGAPSRLLGGEPPAAGRHADARARGAASRRLPRQPARALARADGHRGPARCSSSTATRRCAWCTATFAGQRSSSVSRDGSGPDRFGARRRQTRSALALPPRHARPHDPPRHRFDRRPRRRSPRHGAALTTPPGQRS